MRLRCSAPLLLAVLLAGSSPAFAQAQPSTGADSLPALVREAVQYQITDFEHSGYGLRYRLHRADRREDSIREVIATRNGNVARTLQRSGKPLTEEQEAAERQRLASMSASDLVRHRSEDTKTDKYAVELMRSMPTAMIYTLAPGQPQLSSQAHSQTVLDFTPDPKFQPKSATQSLLTGLAGRLWIDAETHHVVRMDLKIIHDLNLFFGILARVYSGGTLSYEQAAVANSSHSFFTHIAIDVRLRELMVKTVPYRITLDTTGATELTPEPSFRDAIVALLAMPKSAN